MNITFLGSGCAEATKDRDNTYFLISDENVENGSGKVMVDVGGSPLSKLKKVNVNVNSIKTIIFTHFHIDHIYGLPSLLWGMWLAKRETPLFIFCDQQYERKLKEWLDVLQVATWPIKFKILIQTFNSDTSTNIIEDHGFRISTIPAKHSVPTVGLEIISNERICIYSADSEPNYLIKNYKKIDLLIHECTAAVDNIPYHTSLKQILNFYSMDKISKIMLVHLSDNQPYQLYMENLNNREKSKILFANDLMQEIL